MFCRLYTVAFIGVEAQEVSVEVLVSPGLPSFQIVGLPDKAVGESRERIRASFQKIGIGLPAKRITVNLAPADLAKEGSHYDVPIALALLGALNILDPAVLEHYLALGELSLDGKLCRVNGVLPTSLLACEKNRGLVCPHESGPEAAWAGQVKIVAASDLLSCIDHFKEKTTLPQPEPRLTSTHIKKKDMADVKGQEMAKRALEIAAAGGHHTLFIGPPGVGKSMLSERVPSILPPLTPKEALDVTIIHSLSGLLPSDGLVQERPYRDPHHSASLAAIIGGGSRSKPGEISLSHHGVLFLDELPEFSRAALEALRQPLETGRITVARANHHITYPARIQLIAAMNPCRCGFFFDLTRQCSKVPHCALDYQNKISGPLMDRFDLIVTVDDMNPTRLMNYPRGEESSHVLNRVWKTRDYQRKRSEALNSELDGENLQTLTPLSDEAKTLLEEAFKKFKLSARGYHRILRVSRTIKDLEIVNKTPDSLKMESEPLVIEKRHIAEALMYRRILGQ